jgi:hypothetical protein
MQDALHIGHTQRELQGGVGLHRHADAQAVQVHPCNAPCILGLHRFGLHDGGQRGHLHG